MKKVLISTTTHLAGAYKKALDAVGIIPVVCDKPQKASDYDGLLLPGGGDITPFLFHEKNLGSKSCSLTEDVIQLLMFQRFFEESKPILGICKGMQLINVALGGSINQDDPMCSSHIYLSHDQYHMTRALPGSILHTLYGENFITNSAHHQSLKTIGADLMVTQYAHNNVVEGIEHKTAPILGVQWHPERLLDKKHSSGCINGLTLFQYFAALL